MKSVQLLLVFFFLVLAKACPSSKNEETSTKKNGVATTAKNADMNDGKFILKSPGHTDLEYDTVHQIKTRPALTKTGVLVIH